MLLSVRADSFSVVQKAVEMKKRAVVKKQRLNGRRRIYAQWGKEDKKDLAVKETTADFGLEQTVLFTFPSLQGVIWLRNIWKSECVVLLSFSAKEETGGMLDVDVFRESATKI